MSHYRKRCPKYYFCTTLKKTQFAKNANNHTTKDKWLYQWHLWKAGGALRKVIADVLSGLKVPILSVKSTDLTWFSPFLTCCLQLAVPLSALTPLQRQLSQSRIPNTWSHSPGMWVPLPWERSSYRLYGKNETPERKTGAAVTWL